MLKNSLAWVLERELLLLAALGPVFIFPGAYTLAGLILIVGIWVSRCWLRGRMAAHPQIVNWCILVLLVMLPISLWPSVDLAQSWPVFYRIVWGAALFYALVNTIQTQSQLRLVLGALLALVAGLCLVSLVGTNWNRTKVILFPLYNHVPALITDQSILPGGTFHPNVIAGTLAPFVPLALSLAVFSLRANRRWLVALLGSLVGLLVLAVLLTQSRGAWLALGVGLLVLMFLRKRSLRWAALALALLALAAMIVVGRTNLEEAFFRLDTTGSGTSRLEVWNRALYMIRDMPFTGIGLGTFPVILDAFYPSFLAGPEARIPHAHNLFLQVAVDLGLPGMVAFTVLLLACLLAALQVYRNGVNNPSLQSIGAGVFSALVVVAVHGLFDAPLWAARSSPLLWVLLGLSLAIPKGANSC